MTTTIRICAIVSLVVLAGCSRDAAQTGQTLEFFGEPGSGRPFSPAVRVGDMLYLSGQLGVSDGQLAPGGVEAETRQALENIKATVERYGSSMNQVVKCTVFMDDMDEWDRMNAIYVTFFPNNLPARSALGADGLALNGRVEIECIATLISE